MDWLATPDRTTTLYSPSPSEVPEVSIGNQNHSNRLSGWRNDKQLQQSHAARSNLDKQTSLWQSDAEIITWIHSRYTTRETTLVRVLETRPYSTTDSRRISRTTIFRARLSRGNQLNTLHMRILQT